MRWFKDCPSGQHYQDHYDGHNRPSKLSERRLAGADGLGRWRFRRRWLFQSPRDLVKRPSLFGTATKAMPGNVREWHRQRLREQELSPWRCLSNWRTLRQDFD